MQIVSKQSNWTAAAIGSHKRAVMSEVLAMQCMNASAGLLAETPMSRRNDAYTAIFFFRYC